MKILIADDEKNIRVSLSQIVALDGIEAETAENGLSAQKTLQEQRFDALVVDLRMPGLDGLELLRWMNEAGPQIPTIMISAHGEVNDAVAAMKLGAADYVTKPFDPDDLLLRIHRAVEDDRLRRSVRAGNPTPTDETHASDAETGTAAPESQNAAMQRVLDTADRVAPSDSTILITGESGTGKEVLARRIHERSNRATGPFIAVNVGAIPETLIESELFGHEKGAFTGAAARRIGVFEMAAGGTLFLDEIGDLPLHLQVTLLRVLQERTIQRVGGANTIPVDIRVVTATNRNLATEIRNGSFREDLYYRLNVIELHLPPLRERSEDIGDLIGVFLDRIARRSGRSVTGIQPDAVRMLRNYRFPGNIRELENIIERAVLLTDRTELTPTDFAYLDIPTDAPRVGSVTGAGAETGTVGGGSATPQTLAQLEEAAIRTALLRNDGHRERTASELGISRRTLLNKMNAYAIDA